MSSSATGFPNRSIHVLAVMDTTAVSGPARQLIALAKALRGQGVEMRILTFRRVGQDHTPFTLALASEQLSHVVLPERRWLDFRTLLAYRREVCEGRPTLIQTHGYKATCMTWAVRMSGIDTPWLGFFHGDTTENFKVRSFHLLDRLALRFADRVVLVAEALRDRFRHTKNHLVVLPNALLTPTGRGKIPDAVNGILRGLPKPLVGVIGRLSPEKGLDILLDATRILRLEHREFSVAVVGNGPELDNLKTRVESDSGLRSAVRFLGAFPAGDDLYLMLDLLVIPSLSEGLPNVLLEALAMRCRIIATAVGDIPEVLSDPLAGTMVPPGDPVALAKAIGDSLRAVERETDVERERRLTAIESTSARYSLGERVRRHLQLYTDLLNRTSGS